MREKLILILILATMDDALSFTNSSIVWLGSLHTVLLVFRQDQINDQPAGEQGKTAFMIT
jgi:hypothetical protein